MALVECSLFSPDQSICQEISHSDIPEQKQQNIIMNDDLFSSPIVTVVLKTHVKVSVS